jgi:hypothetical protein
MITKDELIEELHLNGDEETHEPFNCDDEDNSHYFKNVIFKGNTKYSFFCVSVPTCECETCKSLPLYGVSREQWCL